MKALEDSKDDASEAAFNLYKYMSWAERKALNLSNCDTNYKFELMIPVLEALIEAGKDQTARDAASTISESPTYTKVLWSMPSTDCDFTQKLMFLKYTNGSRKGKTFFVRTRDATRFFRHGGDLQAIPPFVHVTVAEKDKNDVHVYNQHSGVGKTVELCCSAYIRGADLAIYHQGSWKDEIQADEIAKVLSSTKEVDFCGARQMLAEKIVKRIVGEAVARNRDIFLALKQQCGISKELKLVLAIDEASTCRNLVRAIIRHHKDLGVTAAREFESLLEWKVGIKVLFSVAGTGAAPADIGSSPEFFTIVKPAISRSPELVYEALCRGHEIDLPTYKHLERTHPVLFTFVQYNGRLSSIVLEVLAKESEDSGNTAGFLIRKVVDFFMRCNAIFGIVEKPEELARAGAQTLAVHLFQKAVVVPAKESERMQVADSYEYGVSLQAQATTSQDDLMTRLIHNYGLVVALPFDGDRKAKVRYSVDSAMQLLALFMMGLSPEIDLLESSSFGYEVLSTHLVKCSIASTLAIQEDVRPSIQAALKKIGFGLNKPHATISSEDGFTDYALWTSLDDMIAVHGYYKPQYRETTQHRQEMVRKVVTAPKFPVLQNKHFNKENVQGVEFLLVDRKLIGAIRGMSPCYDDSACFWPPLASVSKGSSPYADGYVTFLAKRNEQSTLCTIMVQAKDYFSSSLNFKELQENIQRCRNKDVSAAFGDSRLMCVASRYDKMVVSKRTYGYLRDFIMFSTNKSSLLSDLMDTLHKAIAHHFTGFIRMAASAADLERHDEGSSAGGDDENAQNVARKPASRANLSAGSLGLERREGEGKNHGNDKEEASSRKKTPNAKKDKDDDESRKRKWSDEQAV